MPIRFSTSLLLLLLLLLATASLDAAVFQYRLSVATQKGERDAFLWLPPASEQIRGVLVAGMTLAEREAVQDPEVRAVCREADLAILFSSTGLGALDLPELLQQAAELSGYSELPRAPLAFIGHSAGGPQAKAKARTYADRCFALMQYRGGGPGGEEPVPAGVPCLMMVGQFDEFAGVMREEGGREPAWAGALTHCAAYRDADPAHLASIVVEAGAGHFAWSQRCAAYFSLFLQKAAAARLPQEWPAEGPVVCRTIDPATGWLTDFALADPVGDPEPVSAVTETTAIQRAWHLDEELARATQAFHASGLQKKDQFIHWQDPFWLDAGTRYFFTSLKWDGDRFLVHPAYAERYPESADNGQGPRWLEAGQAVGHAEVPIRLRAISGPLEVVDDNSFRIRFDTLTPAGKRCRGTFMAYSPGDATYRHTEHIGMLPRGFKGLKKGQGQTITFPAIADQTVDGGPVPLTATSDSGLPVRYYVAYGPARVDSNSTLHITDVPMRARLPIEVVVAAYQFGSGSEPLVKTAVPVRQRFHLVASTP